MDGDPELDLTLRRLGDVTHELLRAARGGDLAVLDDHLNARRELLDRLPDQLQRATESTRRDSAAFLRELLGTDRSIEATLLDCHEEWGRELAALGRGRRGLAGYRGSGEKPAKWIDERR